MLGDLLVYNYVFEENLGCDGGSSMNCILRNTDCFYNNNNKKKKNKKEKKKKKNDFILRDPTYDPLVNFSPLNSILKIVNISYDDGE